ncbi:hypothetical protein [Echinicola pacifica]|nr:hypothetical protein [Echinicola pacifica]
MSSRLSFLFIPTTTPGSTASSAMELLKSIGMSGGAITITP